MCILLSVFYLLWLLTSFECAIKQNYGIKGLQHTYKRPELRLSPSWIATYRYVNEHYEVSCIGQESYKNFKWIRANGKVLPELRGSIHTKKLNKKQLLLVFENITTSSEGVYECVAESNGHNVTAGFQLNVEESISFDVTPVVYAILFDDVFLRCNVKEQSDPKIVWEFEGRPIVKSDYIVHGVDGLFIKNVDLQNAGRYYCIAHQSPFQTNQNRQEILLVIYYKPIMKNPKLLYGFKNEVISIPCQVKAEPPASFIWYKNDNPINPKKCNATILQPRKNASILQVFLKNESDTGAYVCEACNEFGCTNSTIHINWTTKLEKPRIGLWDLSSTTATFFVSTQREVAMFRFEYFFDVEDEHDTWAKPYVVKFMIAGAKARPKFGNNTQLILEKLMPDTNYIVRVMANNTWTSSEYSTERKFRTRIGRGPILPCGDASCAEIKFVLLFIPMIIINLL